MPERETKGHLPSDVPVEEIERDERDESDEQSPLANSNGKHRS